MTAEAGTEFAGRVCVVTGGAKGIGRAICRRFAAAGACVVVLDIDAAGAAATAAELPDARAVVADVADGTAVTHAFAEIVGDLGTLDVLVNNAGIIGGAEYGRMLKRRAAIDAARAAGEPPEPLNATLEMTDDAWRLMLSTHLDGTFHATRAALATMQTNRSGAIVNMSSVVGIDGGAGIPHYAAAKAAIAGFTRSVAQEVAPLGIRVNAVAPGFIDTGMRDLLPPTIAANQVRMTPLGRLGTPEEIAETVAFLASDRASFMVGQIVSPNGGYLSR